MTADQVATDKPIFDVEASVLVNAPVEKVYAVASDITRMGEWSPENTGGEWTTGQPGEVGARFDGHNAVGDWTWTTGCEVVAAEPGRRFAWSVVASSAYPDAAQELHNSVWSFDIEPEGSGARLTQRFVMRRPTRHLQRRLDATDDPVATKETRRAQIEQGLRKTLEGIKNSVEQD